nr:MAG TPA: hypothetical protein [Caudoviricetes sp.]
MNFWLTKVKRWVRMNLFKIFEQKINRRKCND